MLLRQPVAARPVAAPATRLFRRGGALIILFAGLHALWLVLQPGPHALFVAVDNVAQFVGPLLALLAYAVVVIRSRPRGSLAPRGRSAPPDPRRWAPLFLAVGPLCNAVGQIIFTYDEQVLHQAAPFPSWADAAWLATYPALLLGILLLPAHALSLVARTRVVFDGLLIMTAVVTLSWYFVLGPTVLQGDDSPVAQVVGAAYPLADLVLIFCLVLLWVRSTDDILRPLMTTLALALGIIVVADSVFDWQQLHGAYHTGSLLDATWPLGYMVVALVAVALHTAQSGAAARPASAPTPPDAPSPWRTFLPYACVPAVGLLLGGVSLAHTRTDDAVRPGVYLGAGVLLGLVLLRQVLALLENARLYREALARERQVARLNDDLAHAQGELRTVYGAMACGVVVQDGRGRVCDANDAARQLLGDGYARPTRGWTGAVTRPDGTPLADDDQPYARALRTAQPQRDVVLCLTGADGRRRWLQVDAVPIPDAEGAAPRVVSSFIDVTARIRAEEELRVAAVKLAESNQALYDFTSIAAHDLQEPLRKVQAFGDRLATRYGDALGADGQDYLARMQNATRRMQTLITDLLALARVTTTIQPFALVDLTRVTREVLGDLEVRLAETGSRVDIGDLPTIEADPVQMRQLVQNLLGNALKFHHPDAPPVVTVRATIVAAPPGDGPTLCQLTIADNGIGFDALYAARIFGAFQRLHTRAAYEGTGIGLAVCQKIAERHGGTIVATGEPGHGATFTVTLPLVHAARAEETAV